MRKSDLILLFKTFSKEDFIKFGDFLKSPYHNKYQILISLYNILKTHYPDFSSERLSKTKIFGILYPAKTYNDGIMRNIISDLKNMVIEFKTYEAFEKHNYLKNNLKLNILRQNGLFKKFSSLYNKLRKRLSTIKEKDSDQYYNEFLLADSQKKYIIGLNRKINFRKKFVEKHNVQGRIDALNLMLDNLALSFGINAFKIYIQIKRLENLMFFVKNEENNYDYRLNYYNIAELLYKEFKNKLDATNSDMIYLDYNFFSLHTYTEPDNEAYINNLLDVKKNSLELLNISERWNLFSLLITYMHGRVLRGNLNKLKDTFNLIKEFIETKSYRSTLNNTIPDYMLVNTMDYALIAGEVKWAEQFYHTYINDIPEKDRNNISIYCEAYILYSKNKYTDALEKLAKVIYDSVFDGGIFVFKVRLKILYLKIIYELNEHELFYSNIDSFRHFVSNNKTLVINEKERIFNFISYFKKLFHLKNKLNEDMGFEIISFKNDLLNNIDVDEKVWLLTKTEQLELIMVD